MKTDKRNLLELRPVYALIILSSTALMLATGSCKKAATPQNATGNPDGSKPGLVSGTMSDEQIDAMVTQFYNDMKTLKDRSNATDNTSLQQAVLNIEAVYNKYVVITDYEAGIATGELTFTVPAANDGSGFVNMKDVTNVFWSIKDALLAKQSVLTENNTVPTLESFDLEAVSDADGNPVLTNGNYSLKAQFSFTGPNGGTSSTQAVNIFTEAPTHCWISIADTDPLPGAPFVRGQATIDHNTKFLVPGSRNDNLPSAPSALRAKGIYNYKAAYNPNLTGYAYNISTVYASQLTFPTMPAVSNDYVNRGIPDYNLNRIWNTKLYDISQVDEYNTYKHWLTTPMMNFYVAPIKQIIYLNISPGKEFYDFHINTNSWGTGEDNNGFSYTNSDYWYYVKSCRYIRFIPAPLGLSEL